MVNYKEAILMTMQHIIWHSDTCPCKHFSCHFLKTSITRDCCI